MRWALAFGLRPEDSDAAALAADLAPPRRPLIMPGRDVSLIVPVFLAASNFLRAFVTAPFAAPIDRVDAPELLLSARFRFASLTAARATRCPRPRLGLPSVPPVRGAGRRVAAFLPPRLAPPPPLDPPPEAKRPLLSLLYVLATAALSAMPEGAVSS